MSPWNSGSATMGLLLAKHVFRTASDTSVYAVPRPLAEGTRAEEIEPEVMTRVEAAQAIWLEDMRGAPMGPRATNRLSPS